MADPAPGTSAAEPRSTIWLYAGPALILCVGLFASLQVAAYLNRSQEAREFDRFRSVAERYLDRLTDRIAIHGALLRGAAGLIRASQDVVVTDQAFSTYVSRLNLDLNYPGVQGIGYSMTVTDARLRDRALEVLGTQLPAPRLWPEHANAERHAIVLLHPPDPRNKAALGYDMFSEPARRAAIARARDSSSPSLTESVSLVQEIDTDRQAGFLMYVPVYFGVSVPDTIEVRRSRFIGVVYSPFRARNFLSAVFNEADSTRELAIALYDGDNPLPEKLLHRTDPPVAWDEARYVVPIPIDIAGRRWTAVVASRVPFFRNSPINFSTGALITGLIGSAVLAALAFAQARAMRVAEHARDQVRSLNTTLESRIAARTRELEIAREALIATNMDLEATVSRRSDQLRDSIEEAQRFVYVASHDLRAPLVNIVGFSGELSTSLATLRDHIAARAKAGDGAVPPEIRKAIEQDMPEALEFIRTSSERMDRLIKGILKLAREGRRNLNPEILPLRQMLESITAGVQTQLTAAGATCEIEEPLPELVGDRLAVEQVLANIIENAVKYLDPARPGRITVRGRSRGARVEIEVEDNGRGIDQRDHERIFELFRRSGTQDVDGEGLGLAHVRALLRRMDGSISVVSAVGQGSRFVIELPKNLVVSEGQSL